MTDAVTAAPKQNSSHHLIRQKSSEAKPGSRCFALPTMMMDNKDVTTNIAKELSRVAQACHTPESGKLAKTAENACVLSSQIGIESKAMKEKISKSDSSPIQKAYETAKVDALQVTTETIAGVMSTAPTTAALGMLALTKNNQIKRMQSMVKGIAAPFSNIVKSAASATGSAAKPIGKAANNTFNPLPNTSGKASGNTTIALNNNIGIALTANGIRHTVDAENNINKLFALTEETGLPTQAKQTGLTQAKLLLYTSPHLGKSIVGLSGLGKSPAGSAAKVATTTWLKSKLDGFPDARPSVRKIDAYDLRTKVEQDQNGVPHASLNRWGMGFDMGQLGVEFETRTLRGKTAIGAGSDAVIKSTANALSALGKYGGKQAAKMLLKVNDMFPLDKESMLKAVLERAELDEFDSYNLSGVSKQEAPYYAGLMQRLNSKTLVNNAALAIKDNQPFAAHVVQGLDGQGIYTREEAKDLFEKTDLVSFEHPSKAGSYHFIKAEYTLTNPLGFIGKGGGAFQKKMGIPANKAIAIGKPSQDAGIAVGAETGTMVYEIPSLGAKFAGNKVSELIDTDTQLAKLLTTTKTRSQKSNSTLVTSIYDVLDNNGNATGKKKPSVFTMKNLSTHNHVVTRSDIEERFTPPTGVNISKKEAMDEDSLKAYFKTNLTGQVPDSLSFKFKIDDYDNLPGMAAYAETATDMINVKGPYQSKPTDKREVAEVSFNLAIADKQTISREQVDSVKALLLDFRENLKDHHSLFDDAHGGGVDHTSFQDAKQYHLLQHRINEAVGGPKKIEIGDINFKTIDGKGAETSFFTEFAYINASLPGVKAKVKPNSTFGLPPGAGAGSLTRGPTGEPKYATGTSNWLNQWTEEKSSSLSLKTDKDAYTHEAQFEEYRSAEKGEYAPSQNQRNAITKAEAEFEALMRLEEDRYTGISAETTGEAAAEIGEFLPHRQQDRLEKDFKTEASRTSQNLTGNQPRLSPEEISQQISPTNEKSPPAEQDNSNTLAKQALSSSIDSYTKADNSTLDYVTDPVENARIVARLEESLPPVTTVSERIALVAKEATSSSDPLPLDQLAEQTKQSKGRNTNPPSYFTTTQELDALTSLDEGALTVPLPPGLRLVKISKGSDEKSPEGAQNLVHVATSSGTEYFVKPSDIQPGQQTAVAYFEIKPDGQTTLADLAEQFDIPKDKLEGLNPSKGLNDTFTAGERATIPALGDKGISYTTEENFTGKGLAERFGVTYDEIQAINPDLPKPQTGREQRINVPKGKTLYIPSAWLSHLPTQETAVETTATSASAAEATAQKEPAKGRNMDAPRYFTTTSELDALTSLDSDASRVTITSGLRVVKMSGRNMIPESKQSQNELIRVATTIGTEYFVKPSDIKPGQQAAVAYFKITPESNTTLADLSDQLGIPKDKLAGLNTELDPNESIKTGVKVTIPGLGESGVSYTTEKDLTADKLAKMFGVSYEDVQYINPDLPEAADCDNQSITIAEGKTLYIPRYWLSNMSAQKADNVSQTN